MYHEAAKKNGQCFMGFYPPQKAFFFQPHGPVLSFTKIVATLQKLWLLCFTEATRLFIIISNAGATIFEMEPQFLKWSHNF